MNGLKQFISKLGTNSLSRAEIYTEPAASAEPAEPPIDSLLDEIPASLPQRFTAQDEVTLGRTGIRTSRLAMGTGTIGYGGGSNQTRLTATLKLPVSILRKPRARASRIRNHASAFMRPRRS